MDNETRRPFMEQHGYRPGGPITPTGMEPPPTDNEWLQGELVSAPTGSPRWLLLWRDVAVATAATLFCILVIGSAVLGGVALARVGNVANDVQPVQMDPGPTAEPCYIADDPTCVPAGD